MKAALAPGRKSKQEPLKECGISMSAVDRYEQFHNLPTEEKEAGIAQGCAAMEADSLLPMRS